MEVSGQIHASGALPPVGKRPRCPSDRRLDGPQIRYRLCREEISLAFPGIDPGPPGCPDS
jgi:hypothetical protein